MRGRAPGRDKIKNSYFFLFVWVWFVVMNKNENEVIDKLDKNMKNVRKRNLFVCQGNILVLFEGGKRRGEKREEEGRRKQLISKITVQM